MADTKISALAAVTAAALSNEFAVNESGISKKASGTAAAESQLSVTIGALGKKTLYAGAMGL